MASLKISAGASVRLRGCPLGLNAIALGRGGDGSPSSEVKAPASSAAPAPRLELEPLPALGVGIKLKLVGLMVAMTIVVVCPVATYAPARQIREERAAAHDRARVYAGVASRRLRSAVAFEDRETAREVAKRNRQGAADRRDRHPHRGGEQLHGEGKLSGLASGAGRGISDQPLAYSTRAHLGADWPQRREWEML
jgi:hypothetical protein